MNNFTYLNTSINPNLSLTNLHKLNSKIISPKPVKFSQFQLLSPPISKVGLPIDSPLNYRTIALCFNWYLVLIFTSNSAKLILNQYSFPIILTQSQFILNCLVCVLLLSVVKYRKLDEYFPPGVVPRSLQSFRPSSLIWKTTVPMGIFQFVGHITSHKATSVIKVSFVHTIKALSPLVTILIYKVFFKKNISRNTYLTLFPLVVGIMLACYKPGSDFNYSGLIYSVISMVIFVSQNIYSKKSLTPDIQSSLPTTITTQLKKLDKLVILFYCSLIGFLLTLPTYLFNFDKDCLSIDWKVATLIIFNGVSHFIQSLLAFQILASLSPINYSIANILKRIIIIIVAFVIEGKKLGALQAVGLVMTMGGLYGYDRWGKGKD